LQLPTRQCSKLFPLAKFTYNNTLGATNSITPFLANKGYHLNLTIHLEHDLASALLMTLSQTSTSYTNNSGNTLIKLNINTNFH